MDDRHTRPSRPRRRLHDATRVVASALAPLRRPAIVVMLCMAAQGARLPSVLADESQDYEELSALRVLERQLLPERRSQMELLEIGFGVAGPDRLALAGESPLGLLLGESEPTGMRGSSTASLHVGGQLELERALQQVKDDIASVGGSKGGLQLPFGLDCAEQAAVQEYLAIYASKGGGTISTWLRRSGMWREHIETILAEEDVPTDLLYLAMIESGFKPRVKSPANAGGMWQFIPGTAVDMGLRIDEWVDERFDPLKATRAAARYLRKQKELFGSWPLAMAAYNGGAGLVGRAIEIYNSNDYFKLVEYGAMYDETRRYVPRILAAALIGKNLEAFGYESLAFEPSWSYDEVEVPGGVRLSLLADAAKTDLETLQGLNPELLKEQTPPTETRYLLRIPRGSRADFVANFDDLSERYGSEHERIRLRFGETVERVASQLGVPVRVLREINGLSSRERAAYGSELIVPLKGRNPKDEKEKGGEDEEKVVLLPDVELELAGKERLFYDVQKGDQLSEIAAHFGVRENQLALWNALDPDAKLRDSMVLQVLVDTGFDRSGTVLLDETGIELLVVGSPEYEQWQEKRASKKKSSSSSATSYKVKKGDSVSKIAKKFGVKSSDIIRWNNLDKKGTIHAGMRLVIHEK